MKFRFGSTISVAILLFAGVVVAQDIPEMPSPEKEHEWLKRFVGEWATQSQGSMGPDQPPMECTGIITSRMLGEFWVVNEMSADIQGVPMRGMQTIGYDATKKKYVGTWVDSVYSNMWQYEGTVDSSGKILTLEAEGPDFMQAGKTTKFQDIYKFKSADEILTISKMLGADGKWVTFMSGTATRKK